MSAGAVPIVTGAHEAHATADAAGWRERNRAVIAAGLHWVRLLVEALDRSSDPAAEPAAGVARAAFDDGRSALRAAGAPAAIDRLSMLFGLAPFDEDVLILALAPRVDLTVSALYARVHGRPSAVHATAGLALAALAAGDRLAGLARLAPAAPLRRWMLVDADDGPADALTSIHVDDRIAACLLGHDDLDARARSCLRGVAAGPCADRHRGALDALEHECRAGARPAALIVGPRGAGRRAAAVELAARLGLATAELEPRAMPLDALARQARFDLVAREARLGRFAVLIDLAAAASRRLSDDAARQALEVADDALAMLDAVVIVAAEERPPLAMPPPSAQLAPLDAGDRAALWRRALGPGEDSARDAGALADQFLLEPDDIAAIAGAPPASGGRLWAACRQWAGRGLEGLAERIEPRAGWDDIVLPAAVLHDLHALTAQVRHRPEVYRDWGFAERLPRGRGVTALLAGPSGTGKTMAAEVVARALDLDLFRIDLAGVVSKYIGETEKNLRRVFDAAEAGGAVLFFDEADALFGKRSEVRDSHDRYANIEVSYLLQRMEAYSGLAILATNLKSHLDASFLRRLRYVIDIPFPDASLRRAIWARAFPAGAPAGGLDLDALARLEIAGGSITVIAVNAAFLAAAEGAPIGMAHVARAARAEFRKLDKDLHAPWEAGRG
jgi:hypothetical protein